MKKKASWLCMLFSSFAFLPVGHSEPANEEKTYTLPDMIVYGERPNEFFPGDQVVRKNSLGIMGNLDFMDVPFGVMSLSEKAIDMNRSSGNTLLEVLTLDPTVTSNGDNTYNDVRIRGYNLRSQHFYINGVPGMLSPSSVPTNFVEKVDIISGPNTLLNGMSFFASVSGAVNLVPKVAEEEPLARFTESFSGKSHFSHELDLGTRFGKNKAWGVRANFSIADGETRFRHENIDEKNFFINFDYRDDRTSAQLLLGHRDVEHRACQTGIRLNGQQLPKAPTGDMNFQMNWGEYSHANKLAVFSIDHKITPTVECFFKTGYHVDDWDPVIAVYYPRLTDANGNFRTVLEMIREHTIFKGYAGGFRLKAKTPNLRHDIVLSADRLDSSGWIEYDKDFYDGTRPGYRGNIYDKSSFDMIPPPTAPRWDYRFDNNMNTMTGFSLMDHIVTDDDRWSFLLGLRHQKVAQGSRSSSRYSPNFGVMYTLNPHVKLYANLMEGLGRGRTVGRRYANRGEYLPPQTTEQYEIGVKWDDRRLGGNFSIFSVEQENYGVDAANNFGYHGRQKNRGAQLTVFGKPLPKLNLIGGIMYLDPKQKGGRNDGMRLPGLSKWNFTLATEYEMTPEWSLTGRFIANSSAPMNPRGTKHVPSWWRLDLGAQYKHQFSNGDILRARLNVFNVLNREYWLVRDVVDEAVTMHGPRSLSLTVSYEF